MLILPVSIASPEGEKVVDGLLERFRAADSSCREAVKEILQAVRDLKNEAVLAYGRKFDAPDLTVKELQVSSEELKEA